MKSISSTYHRRARIHEKLRYTFKVFSGKRVCIGKTYNSLRDKKLDIRAEGPISALDYDRGLLLVGDPESGRYAIIHDDIIDIDGSIYIIGSHLTGVFTLGPIDEILKGAGTDAECIERLRNASRVKWFYRLNEDEAALLLRWHRNRERNTD